MLSMKFVKKISKAVSTSNLKRMNEIIRDENRVFRAFLTANLIGIDEFIDHIYDAYAEGGLIAAS